MSPVVDRWPALPMTHDTVKVMDSAKLSRHVSFDERSMTAVSSFIQGSLEGDTICQGKWTGQKIGVFTSGGDAQGMNAAVRAIVRVGMYLGCKVYYINEGYQGMVDGGEHIQEATWQSTSNIIHMGGTVIGSARCMEFKERWGRLKAAQNLIHWGITNLIAIGGDGSLTGADLFRQEWPSLVRELVDKEILTKDKLSQFGSINIVGLVGSIDNDFCGTDMTIGVDSALHRIQEAVDNIMTTAVSHKRAFVLEIMGRMCGFLPLAAGISSEATFIFIPEEPPLGDWRQLLCEQMMEKSKSGEVRRTHIILVAEGAIDSEGNQIKCTDVQKTKLVGEKMAEKNFEEVVTLRGRPIVKNLAIYALQSKVITHPSLMPPRRKKIYRIAMLHVGSPACGMNAVARGFVSVCVSRGYEPVFVYNSWEGLSARKVKAVVWNDVHHWTSKGGSLLGTNTKTAQEIGLGNIADALNELDISGLVIVGGFEAYESACQIHHAREHYEELCVPVAVVPATIANNVPGAVMCIGCDTALNQICKACDDLKQSAFSIQKCVYIVEVGGDNCGYLATLAAIAAGADFAFIQEENFSVRDIQNLCHTIKHKFEYSGVEQALLIRNENANPNLTTDFIFRIFNEEGKPSCTARQTKLGHIQEGYKATPYDRAAGIRAGSRCTDWMINAIEANGGKDKDKIFTKSPTTVVVYCSRKEMAEHMPVDELMLQTDFEKRLPKRQWWTKLRGLMDILSWSNVITD
ncbi:ATP-dependent 6-phosphofructokinase-like isoform X4 [Physella acuta]|uniref:ATP-dependent 6-phosphofructokinase-like isoform X4 n=1 Tax=Physella acuta TaxID=109671 RepID=UPI0027DE1EB2|nr:ATP-dependent 6-phosphofructokinase-like isoform X4 [Physella acuta]